MESKLLELLTAPRRGINVSLRCRLDVLVFSPHRATTATIVEMSNGVIMLETAPGWSAATAVELELRPLDGPEISVHGVIAAVCGTSIQIDLLPVHDAFGAARLRRFVVEGIRRRVVDEPSS